VDAEVVQTLAKNTARLCQESVVVYSNSESLAHHAASSLGKLHRMVRRKLRTGRLPYESVPTIHGAPSDGGVCDACDQPFTTRQLVMAVPVGDAFVHLHADCFMVWNEERDTTPAAPRSRRSA
jgi:hypothetical protein